MAEAETSPIADNKEADAPVVTFTSPKPEVKRKESC